MDRKPLTLFPGREKRILQGHRWIFANEISDRLPGYEPGSWVDVKSAKGAPLGSGYVNPRSLIAVRLVCRPGEEFTRELFHERVARADMLRRRMYPESSCYRAVYGESDGLPGLVVDRYADVLVYQITSLGMSMMEPLVRDVLTAVFRPKAIVFRNDASVRALEGLPLEKGIAFGEVPQPLRVDVDGIRYMVDPIAGQKTGLFLDQRDNRRALRRWVKDAEVLDLFCYTGAWGLTAAANGARRVVGVDESGEAVRRAEENARENGLADLCEFHADEVLHFLKNIGKSRFDVVIVDPPAFAKTKSALPAAKKGYTDLNRRAILSLKPGGLLVSCSCSRHLSEESFREILLQAGRASGRQLRLIEARGQALDHPMLLAMPETEYLKCFFLEAI